LPLAVSTTPHLQPIHTIGHSTLPLQRFLALLGERDIAHLADVRRFPASRLHPQFNAAGLAAALAAAGIGYTHFVELGGRRTPKPDSRNLAWRNTSFRGYADYMETRAYAEARGRLVALAQSERTALMCAEAMWWQCHRSLIADDLKARGFEVLHIMGDRVAEHPYTEPAIVVDGRVQYAPPSLF
jgi:uncharacterized protein (DUF488 family)